MTPGKPRMVLLPRLYEQNRLPERLYPRLFFGGGIFFGHTSFSCRRGVEFFCKSLWVAGEKFCDVVCATCNFFSRIYFSLSGK